MFTASLISVTMIIILNMLYDRVARKLTDWECHRTDVKYENSLTYKMFWFQFINYYFPLVYRGRKIYFDPLSEEKVYIRVVAVE